jgi:hypothetical protein
MTDFISSEDETLRPSFALREHLWFRMLPAIKTYHHFRSVAQVTFFVPACFNAHTGAGILTCSSSHYALRPRLRSRLTPGGLTWPGKPWVFGDKVSHFVYRYSLWHNLSSALQCILSVHLHSPDDAPLPRASERIQCTSEASVPGLSPVKFSARSHLTSELLRVL